MSTDAICSHGSNLLRFICIRFAAETTGLRRQREHWCGRRRLLAWAAKPCPVDPIDPGLVSVRGQIGWPRGRGFLDVQVDRKIERECETGDDQAERYAATPVGRCGAARGSLFGAANIGTGRS